MLLGTGECHHLLNSQRSDTIDLVAPVAILFFRQEPVIRELHQVPLNHVEQLLSVGS